MTIAQSIFFAAERDCRHKAALERDLAASTPDPVIRDLHLRQAASLDARTRPQLDAYLFPDG
jgi:hypothetical protein